MLISDILYKHYYDLDLWLLNVDVTISAREAVDTLRTRPASGTGV